MKKTLSSKVAHNRPPMFFSVLPKTAWSAHAVENPYSFFNVSYTWYKSLSWTNWQKSAKVTHCNIKSIANNQYGQSQSEYKWKVGDKYYHSIKVHFKRPIICINWNPPFGPKFTWYLWTLWSKIYFIRNVRVLIWKYRVIIDCQAYCVYSNKSTIVK